MKTFVVEGHIRQDFSVEVEAPDEDTAEQMVADNPDDYIEDYWDGDVYTDGAYEI
jgi:hypothetical protein